MSRVKSLLARFLNILQLALGTLPRRSPLHHLPLPFLHQRDTFTTIPTVHKSKQFSFFLRTIHFEGPLTVTSLSLVLVDYGTKISARNGPSGRMLSHLLHPPRYRTFLLFSTTKAEVVPGPCSLTMTLSPSTFDFDYRRSRSLRPSGML